MFYRRKVFFYFLKDLLIIWLVLDIFVLNDKMKDDIYKNGTDEAKIAVKFLETFCNSNSIKFDFVILHLQILLVLNLIQICVYILQ